ncbi:hypothetical protein GBA52_006429 [Prunus armeniaca]|nr:hypothetical protein GBA52_006429 [Prunus armeniaca]
MQLIRIRPQSPGVARGRHYRGVRQRPSGGSSRLRFGDRLRMEPRVSPASASSSGGTYRRPLRGSGSG